MGEEGRRKEKAVTPGQHLPKAAFLALAWSSHQPAVVSRAGTASKTAHWPGQKKSSSYGLQPALGTR